MPDFSMFLEQEKASRINELEIERYLNFFDSSFNDNINLAGELEKAKRERSRAQYYTGSWFMREEYKRKARRFLEFTVEPYLDKIRVLTGD